MAIFFLRFFKSVCRKSNRRNIVNVTFNSNPIQSYQNKQNINFGALQCNEAVVKGPLEKILHRTGGMFFNEGYYKDLIDPKQRFFSQEQCDELKSLVHKNNSVDTFIEAHEKKLIRAAEEAFNTLYRAKEKANTSWNDAISSENRLASLKESKIFETFKDILSGSRPFTIEEAQKLVAKANDHDAEIATSLLGKQIQSIDLVS